MPVKLGRISPAAQPTWMNLAGSSRSSQRWLALSFGRGWPEKTPLVSVLDGHAAGAGPHVGTCAAIAARNQLHGIYGLIGIHRPDSGGRCCSRDLSMER